MTDGDRDRALWMSVREAALQLSSALARRTGLPKYLGEEATAPAIGDRELLLLERRAWLTITEAIERRYRLPVSRKQRQAQTAAGARQYTAPS